MCVRNSNQNRGVFFFVFFSHTLAVGITPQRFSGLSDNSFYGLNYGNEVGFPNKIRRDPIGPPSTVGSTLFKHTACSSQHELILQISTDRHPHPHSDTCLMPAIKL